MLDSLETLDHWLFYAINSRMTNPWLDWFMPAVTDLHKNPTILYTVFPAILVLWIFLKRGQALKLILGLSLCIACTDMVTYRILKPSFKRQRPPELLQTIELRTDRYAGYSFPSNHAANNFAAATFLSMSYPFLTPFAFGIAGIVAYSRVYVGVHFPMDVLAGGLWASLFAFVFFIAWRKIFKTDVVKKPRI